MTLEDLKKGITYAERFPRFGALAFVVRCARRVQPLFDRLGSSSDWPNPAYYDFLIERAELGAASANGQLASFAAAKAEQMGRPDGAGEDELYQLMMAVGSEAGAYYLSPPSGEGDLDSMAEAKHVEEPGTWLIMAIENSVAFFKAAWEHGIRDEQLLVDNVFRDLTTLRAAVREGRLDTTSAMKGNDFGALWEPGPPAGWPRISESEAVQLLSGGEAGVSEWNRKRFRNNVVLDGVNLQVRILVGADLSKLSMRGANLHGANLMQADLRGSDLSNSNLSACSLDRAYLTDACLEGADLQNARLIDTALERANLRRSKFGGTTVIGRLTDVIGVADIEHKRSSRPDIWTLRSLRQQDADAFICGCHLDEQDEAHFRALVAKPLQYYECFISYSVENEAFVDQLYDGLDARGIRCWKFNRDAKWGSRLRGEIDRAIRVFDRVLVILSKSSLASVPVQDEIDHALQEEAQRIRDGKLADVDSILLPIRIDDSIFKWTHPLARDIRSRYIVDATPWPTNAALFKAGLDSLASALARSS